MSTTSSREQAVTAMDLVERAESLSELLRAQAGTNDEFARLSNTAVEALKGAHLLNFCSPPELGGLELRPTEALAILEQLAYADGSAGWVAMVTNSLAMMLTYLESDVARITVARSPMAPTDSLMCASSSCQSPTSNPSATGTCWDCGAPAASTTPSTMS